MGLAGAQDKEGNSAGMGSGQRLSVYRKSAGGRARPTYQVVAPMLGLQHLSHFTEIAAEVLLISCAGEGHGNDALGDIHQVQLTTVFHGSAHAHVSRETE